jgi:hypothetical protein
MGFALAIGIRHFGEAETTGMENHANDGLKKSRIAILPIRMAREKESHSRCMQIAQIF